MVIHLAAFLAHESIHQRELVAQTHTHCAFFRPLECRGEKSKDARDRRKKGDCACVCHGYYRHIVEASLLCELFFFRRRYTHTQGFFFFLFHLDDELDYYFSFSSFFFLLVLRIGTMGWGWIDEDLIYFISCEILSCPIQLRYGGTIGFFRGFLY